MDVQTENTDPPPNESQPSGKIRKGFKLFGKRKPGNIFSIRSKGDGNNKSPVIKSKTLDGLSETPAPDSEDADKEKGQEVSQGETEQAEDEALGEDGVLAAAPARTSISSVSSAKSLSFLSLLRGGRRGVGDRRVHTVSQPVGRQRRGLKGLFGNVKLRSKDKEDKEEAPPSPLLMSSRANSVEIIKEDLTLTPKCRPRSLDSPKTESSEPVPSSSAATSPSETTPPRLTADTVSKTDDHVLSLPTPEPPLVPGDKSLSTLLADISSLLTFDSISGGGDIMADVEAEWGKSSRATSPVAADVTPSPTSVLSKPSISSSPVSTAFSTAAAAKPSFVSIPSSTSAKPSTILTSFTKSSTLTSHSVKVSSASDSSASIKVNLTPAPTTTKPSATPVTLSSFSAPVMSSASKTTESTASSISTAAAAPPRTTSTAAKAPSFTPSPPFSASKPASEITLPSQNIVSVSKPSPVASSPPASAKPPVTHSPPIPVTKPPPVNLDSFSSFSQQKTTSYKPAPSVISGDSAAPMSVSTTCAGTTKLSSSTASDISSKMTSAPTFATTSGSVAPSLSKPTIIPTTVTLNNTPPSLVTVSDPRPSSALTAINKIQPSPPSVSAPSSTLDKIPPTTKPTTASYLDKMASSAAATPAVSAASATPTTLGQITVSPASANIQVSLSKELPAQTHKEVSQSKSTPAPVQVPVSVAKDPPAPIKMQAASPEPPAAAHIVVSGSRDPAAPVKMQAILSKDPPAPAQIQIPVSKDPLVPFQTPVSVSKDPPAPAQIQIPVSKAPLVPSQTPVSVSKDPPAPSQNLIPVSKDPPAPSQIQIPVSKAPLVPSQTPVSVCKDPSAPAQNLIPVSKDPPASSQSPVSVSKDPPIPAQIPPSVPKDPLAPVSIPVSAFKAPPAPAQIPVSLSKTHPAPTADSFPATSPPSPPEPLLSDAAISAKMKGSGQTLVDHQFAGPGSQAVSSKTKELANESQVSLQGSSKEKRPPQVKASGLSKIPVVGGGRVGKLPVRDSQNTPDEPSRDPPTPVLEERPHFNSHDAGSKDKISTVEANAPTSKHTQEESQQPQQPKVLTSSARDSKIPVKHGTQSHSASQIPQPTRTKIPVSKVPVRKVGNKPAPTGGGTQMRK